MSRPLEQVNLKVNQQDRAFYFRSDSAGDRGVIQQIFQMREYDLSRFAQHPQFAAYYSTMVGSGKRPLIIDAGSNIGASAVYFSGVFPQGRILAIEPEKHNCELLRKNSEGLNILVMEGGIGCNKGFLYLADPGRGDWGFRLGEQGDYQVPVFAAADLLAEHAGPDYLPLICKIDIEGGELELFRENTGWIARFPLVVIELHDWLIPGKAISRNFLRAISGLNFDFVYRGENIFCFNNDLLAKPA